MPKAEKMMMRWKAGIEKMKMRFIFLLLIITIMISCSGCAKLVNTENKTVQVTIVDKYHRGSFVTIIRTGKTTVPITHPAIYRITVEHEGKQYTVSGSTVYNKYKDKMGEITNAIIEIKYYDDGTIKTDIISLE